MTVFFFLIKEGFKGLIRSQYAGLFTIFIISISLILIGLGFVTSRDMVFAVQKLKSQFELEVFLKYAATDREIEQFYAMLDSMPEILHASYISPDSAAKRFKKEFGEDIYSILDYNPLPPSFTIELKPIYRNIVSVEGIIANIRKNPIVDEVKYRRNLLLTLEKYQRIIFVIATLVFLFFTFVSIVLVSNSIKMTIFARRELISTLKLIGATNTFVKVPFFIEGALEGIIGAIISCGFFYALTYVANNFFYHFVYYKIQLDLKFYVGLISLGFLFGLIGSLRTVGKFLGKIG